MTESSRSNEAGHATAALPRRSTSELIWGHVAPAFVFQLQLLSKAEFLAQRLQAGPRDETPLFFTVSVLQQALAIVFLAFIVVLFVVRRPVAGRRSNRVGGVVALAAMLVVNVPTGARVIENNLALSSLSSALILAGLLWSVVSLTYLGRCFGIFPEARGVVTRGPYRWVRHPLYLGELTSALGLVVATASIAMFGVFLALCGLQYWRMRLEEDTLTQAFPAYAEYARRTYRILPGVH